MLHDLVSLNSLYHLNWSWLIPTPEATATIALISAFAVFALLEARSPRKKVNQRFLRQSYSVNLSLFLFNSLVMTIPSAFSIWVAANQHGNQGFLHTLTSPVLKTTLSLLALDLLLYIWHRACHSHNALWMFHKIHHNDPHLNVSTGFRVHIAEMTITFLLKAMTIILLGIDALIVLIHEVTTTLFVMFHHTNSRFTGEKWLGYVFTTPTLHRTHHSVERKEHDNNYGAMLTIWDRLFGTFLEREPTEIGVKGNPPLDFVSQLKFGFVPYASPATMPVNLDLMIAEAAYYKAEKRNFMPGHEWDDWLEAKRDVLNMVNEKRKDRFNVYTSMQRNSELWLHKLCCSLGMGEERRPKTCSGPVE